MTCCQKERYLTRRKINKTERKIIHSTKNRTRKDSKHFKKDNKKHHDDYDDYDRLDNSKTNKHK